MSWLDDTDGVTETDWLGVVLPLGVDADEPLADWVKLPLSDWLDVCDGVGPRADALDDWLGVAAALEVDVELRLTA